ncbi:Demethylmenaquinone methyltransferase [Metarhizium album ARSEF 1941]|uniref:Demethylmenaquinone methyltransferase n=1 Tax=Metarhizium album (strain ARSEF 1941) TaxID=1081103 RepID=A0A0B2X0E7_METAS|nr:Demethylmenaquinone methyltransferase [Metarhizium album ARSEF 1941]KHN99152.1 Demethylmenaquinone methyltransferase [Metarhizium album ARSEF 1941]
MSTAALARLERYTACDVSDALLKLKVPGAGFIADLSPYSTKPGKEAESPTVAPVSTVLFAAKGEAPAEPAPNVPKDGHWSDATQPGTFVVMRQPPGQTNAICGGIMALRIKMRRAKGIIVAGRVRDVQELKRTDLPILARGVSTVGSGGGSVPWATQVPLDIDGVVVSPGDVALHDPANGVVIIPRDKLDQVLEMLPGLVAADDRVKQDVLKGMSVHDAFKLHRGT